MGDKLSASPDFVHEQYQIDKSMSDNLPFAIPSAPCKASCHRAAVFFTGVMLQVVLFVWKQRNQRYQKLVSVS